MPQASLLVIASPMLLGPVPDAGLAAVDVADPAPLVAPASLPNTPSLLPLNWSLVQAQSGPPEGLGPQDDRPEGQEGDEIVVEGEYGPPEGDPMAAVNEASYRIVQDIDSALVGPIAYGYRDGLPGPVRDGLSNVVRNLREPVNFLNFLLQFKFGDAVETLARFTLNSTLGIGGLIDVAGQERIGLPYRRNGFANTLGYYGVDTGAYLYLPIAGATTVRDLIGDSLDQTVLPFAFGRPFNTPEYAVPYFIVSNLDARLEVDNELAAIEGAVDPYAARRDTYLYYREREIARLKGEPDPPRPEIVIEIEEITEELDREDAAEEAGQAAPLSESDEDTLGFSSLATAIAVTRPRGYQTIFAGAEPLTR